MIEYTRINERITSLQEIVKEIDDNVEIINLHCNQLVSLEGLPHYQKLVELTLSSNIISRHLQELVYLPVLETLDLSANKISSLSQLPFLPSLKSLLIAFNQIECLDYIGENCPDLEYLDIRGNKLAHATDIYPITELKYIKSIDFGYGLKGNSICQKVSVITDIFHNCPSLEAIDGKSMQSWENEAINEISIKTPKFDILREKMKKYNFNVVSSIENSFDDNAQISSYTPIVSKPLAEVTTKNPWKDTILFSRDLPIFVPSAHDLAPANDDSFVSTCGSDMTSTNASLLLEESYELNSHSQSVNENPKSYAVEYLLDYIEERCNMYRKLHCFSSWRKSHMQSKLNELSKCIQDEKKQHAEEISIREQKHSNDIKELESEYTKKFYIKQQTIDNLSNRIRILDSQLMEHRKAKLLSVRSDSNSANLQKQILDVERQRDELENDNFDLRKDLETQLAKISDLEKLLAEQNSLNNDLATSIALQSKCIQEHESKEVDYNLKIKSLNQDIETSQNKLLEINSQYKSESSKSISFQSSYELAKSEILTLGSQILELKNELLLVKSQNKNMNDEVQNLKAVNKQLKDNNDQLLMEKKTLSNTIVNLSRDLHLIKGELESLSKNQLSRVEVLSHRLNEIADNKVKEQNYLAAAEIENKLKEKFENFKILFENERKAYYDNEVSRLLNRFQILESDLKSYVSNEVKLKHQVSALIEKENGHLENLKVKEKIIHDCMKYQYDLKKTVSILQDSNQSLENDLQFLNKKMKLMAKEMAFMQETVQTKSEVELHMINLLDELGDDSVDNDFI